MNKKTTYFFDSVFGLFIAFALSYLLFIKLNHDKTLVFIAAVAFSFAADSIWLRLLYRKKPKKNYSRYLSQFTHRSNEQNAEIIFNALKTRYNCALFGNVIKSANADVIVFIRHSPLSEQDAIDFALSAERKTLLIVSSTEKNALQEAERTNKNLRIIAFEQIAGFLLSSGAIKTPPPVPVKNRLSAFFISALDGKNAGRYLSGAGLMFLLSAINAFSPYYLCFAALLVALSLSSFIKGKISGMS